MFVNGAMELSAADSSALPCDATLSVGGQSGSYFFDGYIDELRITKGVARYTTNFTPPTAQLTVYP